MEDKLFDWLDERGFFDNYENNKFHLMCEWIHKYGWIVTTIISCIALLVAIVS